MAKGVEKPSRRFVRAMREMRERHGWTQGELAERLSIDRATVARIEAGKRGLSLDEAYAISEALVQPPPRPFLEITTGTAAMSTPTEKLVGNAVWGWVRGVRQGRIPNRWRLWLLELQSSGGFRHWTTGDLGEALRDVTKNAIREALDSENPGTKALATALKDGFLAALQTHDEEEDR